MTSPVRLRIDSDNLTFYGCAGIRLDCHVDRLSIPHVGNVGFIDRYVFPDGELEGVGTIITAMQDHGFEVRHEENLREHYAKTLAGWCANLSEHWDEAVAEIAAQSARQFDPEVVDAFREQEPSLRRLYYQLRAE